MADKQQSEPVRAWQRAERQKSLVRFILVLAGVNIAYRLVYLSGFSQTAALYVGIPALMAIGLAREKPAKSTTGMLLRRSTIALLIACVVLPEGLICLLFVLPLVALVAVVVGRAIDYGRRRGTGEGPPMFAVGLPLLLMSLEGVVGSPFDPHDTVSRSLVVYATPAEVAAAVATPPEFSASPPAFIAIGFNRAIGASGGGNAVGDTRVIEFTGGSHDDHPLRVFGGTGHRSTHHHASMRLTVVQSAPGRVVFHVDEDSTMLSRWVDLNEAIVTWTDLGDGRTRVTWRLEYERLIYPTAYFGPMQRFGMGEAAQYLLDNVIAEQL